MKNNIKELWDIKKLKNWADNPKKIEDDDFERLKNQIRELGVYKPLIVMTDGTVLGGNSRLLALKDLGEEKVWVYVVSAPTRDLMIEYALSDNDASGDWNNGELVELLANIEPSRFSDYKIDAGFILNLEPVKLNRETDEFQTDATRESYETAEKGQIVLFLDNEQKERVDIFIEQYIDAHELPNREAVLVDLLENYGANRNL